jgi:adenine phosphoribosyltransferase
MKTAAKNGKSRKTARARVIDLKGYIRDIPDFPKKGIIFKDITTLLNHPLAFKTAIDLLVKRFRKDKIDYIVAVESRGFIFGSVLAYKLGAGFVPVRKKGKLPYQTRSVTYALEYGTDTLEMHEDAIRPNSRVLIVDDLLATGGTVSATVQLIENFKAKVVGVVFLVELTFLNGKEKLKNVPIYSIIKY